jgi:hypothetical protein
LGHIITDTLDDGKDMWREIRAIYSKVNYLIRQFGACSVGVKKLIWQSFVNCLYGVGLWQMAPTVLEVFVGAYNKCLKCFFGYSKYETNRVVYLSLGLLSVATLIHNSTVHSINCLTAFSRGKEWVGHLKGGLV